MSSSEGRVISTSNIYGINYSSPTALYLMFMKVGYSDSAENFTTAGLPSVMNLQEVKFMFLFIYRVL